MYLIPICLLVTSYYAPIIKYSDEMDKPITGVQVSCGATSAE